MERRLREALRKVLLDFGKDMWCMEGSACGVCGGCADYEELETLLKEAEEDRNIND